MVAKIRELFKDEEDLVKGFDRFLPEGYRGANGDGGKEVGGGEGDEL